MVHSRLSFSQLREQVIGMDARIDTVFGERTMMYCDYTASGRSLHFVERYLQGLLQGYANTHTEDDITGRGTSRLLHVAEDAIKRVVNAGPQGKIIACGTGATGAIDKLQQILGVAIAPATRARLNEQLIQFFGTDRSRAFDEYQRARQPVIFVGPYEHHSNEVSWRQGLATVVTVDLRDDGGIDLEHLAALLGDPAYRDRPRIGSFSAASNVTGIRTPVHEIAALLHRHCTLACFDYAASGPYVAIDMNPGSEAWLDAIFLSPHKFVGGPGSTGVLVFNERLYRHDLPPTVAGGGTVDYVSPTDQDFVADIEVREKAGTPGILQTLRAALAFEIKAALTPAAIEGREAVLLARAFGRWTGAEGVEILGNRDPALRIGIVSFNVRDPRGGYLHPKFVTALLNDLFGIQSRAGCSCAGPYGHRLLAIGHDVSEQYRAWVRKGYQGIKPGWCRIGFHFVMDDVDADFVIEAVLFAAAQGYKFLPLYRFDPFSGAWQHRDTRDDAPPLSLDAALTVQDVSPTALPAAERARLFAGYLAEARSIAASLGEPRGGPGKVLDGAFGELQFFSA
jgi:selenocysteine lyase/cysteine desulfurase